MAATSAASHPPSVPVANLATTVELKTYLQSVGGVELCTALTKLSGGYVNLTCRSTRSDGSTVIVKYAQAKGKPDWPAQLSADRARDEQEMLKRLTKEMPFITYRGVDSVELIEVGSPKGLGYMPERHVQLIEDFPDTMDFESLLMTTPIGTNKAHTIGVALGVYIIIYPSSNDSMLTGLLRNGYELSMNGVVILIALRFAIYLQTTEYVRLGRTHTFHASQTPYASILLPARARKT